MRRIRTWAGVILFLLAAFPPAGWSADEKWQTGLSATYTTGDYGTNSRTNILYVPFSLRRLFADGDLTLTIPYIRITSNGNVTLIGGVPNRTGRLRTARTTARVTESGLGDMILQGRYYILDERKFLPTIALTARVKAPTADADKGLGTGEWDEGVGAEVSKKFGEQWIGFFDLGYTVIGKPAGVTLRNQWNYDVGLGYYLTQALLASLYYEEWTAVVPGTPNPRDLLFSIFYKASSAVRFNLALEKGLSDGAPNVGITGGASFRF
jgi:outer membrane putative beta-barrel porin/alpha-amylase